jgi:hypothetical protein
LAFAVERVGKDKAAVSCYKTAMAHRAHYILRRGGRTQRFSSRWGGLSLAQDIFWGPDETTRFIRSLEPTEEWPNPNSCEAGAVIDWDARHLIWFEADYLRPGRLEQRLYALLLQQTWPDWQIRFAADESLACADERKLEILTPAVVPGERLEADVARPEAELDPDEAEPTAERTCLASLVSRLLDQTRFDPQIMLGGMRRATREADAGCSCLTVMATLGAVAIAAWIRTAPAITVCVLAVLLVLGFSIRIRQRSARLIAMVEQEDDAPQASGPSLMKKRSILDRALSRLGYPTTEQLELAGELTIGATTQIPGDGLPDRFGPLRPLRADEVAGVSFYQLQLNRLRFRELWRGTTLWQASWIKLLAPFGHHAGPTIPVPRVLRLILLAPEDLPPHVHQEFQPWLTQAADNRFTTAFFYTLPMLGRQEAYSAVLLGAEGTLLASFLYARVRLRIPNDETDDDTNGENSYDEEMFEASLLTVLSDGKLLITSTRSAELDPLPGHELQTWEDADWPTLLAAHQRRLAPRVPAELRLISAAELPDLLLRWNQQETDHHIARGVYQRMSREDIDRFATEG